MVDIKWLVKVTGHTDTYQPEVQTWVPDVVKEAVPLLMIAPGTAVRQEALR